MGCTEERKVMDMPLRIRHLKEEEAPKPTSTGKVNEDLHGLKTEMTKLASGAVLEIEAGSEKAVRGVKALVTRAGRELGSQWRHWHAGTKVFAKPVGVVKRRVGRRARKPN